MVPPYDQHPHAEAIRTLQTSYAKMAATLEYMEKERETYVTKAEYAPIKLLVYGAAALILSSVFGALVLLVVKGGG